jgi:2-iminobutanoate/2-iminopropanoate deaminase
MSLEPRVEWLVPALQEPISHYAHAVSFGDLVFISGCLATDDTGALVGGEQIEAQAHQTLHNLEAALSAAGSSLDDVLKVTVYVTAIEDRERLNAVREQFFGRSRPASTLVEVSRLAVAGATVEIDAIACKSQNSRHTPFDGSL